MKNLEIIHSKMFTRESLRFKLNMWRFQDKKIVFTNGCFDLIHRGHIDYLSKAADLGDILVIGVNSDESVSKLKGFGRPLQNLESRLEILASMFFVNAVVSFEEDTPLDLIRFIQPDILVKGADYREDQIVGSDIVKSKNGIVVTIPYLENYSTSLIEKKIIRNIQIKE